MRLHLIGRTPPEPAWRYGIAGALMLAGPVGRELYVNYYPARPEAFVLPLVAGILGALVAISSRHLGGLVGTLMFGGLLFVFADLQFDLDVHVRTAFVLAGCIALAQLLVTHRAAIFAAGLGALYLSSIVRPANSSQDRIATASGTTSRGPLLVHVILDEQWGIGGLRAAGDSGTADFLTTFYLEHCGFTWTPAGLIRL